MLCPAHTLMLVTGATGLVGSHVAERARLAGLRIRALVRENSDPRLLQEWGVEIVSGDITETDAVRAAMQGVTHVVHCAARLGDWGPVAPYREVNVRGFGRLLAAGVKDGSLQRLVHISSMAVYEPRDHFGTDETEPVNKRRTDAYALTKVEAEELLREHIARDQLPGVILRPGWIYGPRDRVVVPRILARLRDRRFAFLGSGEQLMNNVFVENLVDAIFLALEHDAAVGQAFNVTDPRLVTKHEFFGSIAELSGLPRPTRHVPLAVARPLTHVLEALWKLGRAQEPPLLSKARIKLLGLNLEYSIAKARTQLGYDPRVDFADGIARTMAWFNQQSAAAARPAAGK